MSARVRRALLGSTTVVALVACTNQLSPSFTTDPPTEPVRLLDPGDGRDFDLVVPPGNMPLTMTCRVLLESTGDVLVLSSSGGFIAGDRVLAWQVQESFASSGVGEQIAPPSRGGVWEVFAVRTVDGPRLTLHSPAFHDYASDGAGARAQACRIPQFANVTVAVDGTLSALRWSEAEGVGGLLAFFANGVVDVGGAIRADGAGFTGGIGVNDPSEPAAEDVNLLETTSLLLSGSKGAGLDGRSCLLRGRGNFANAGGGGNAHNAGGGGGGAAGRGGNGGMQSLSAGDEPDTAGIGGAAITTDPSSRLVMGGGGGAAHQDNGTWESAGNGGGIVLIAADRLQGSGAIEANGANGPDESRISDDGGPGAGAGGVVFVLARSSTPGVTFRARGGRGGDVGEDNVANTPRRGPGGGGGGGWIVLRGVGGSTDAGAGPAGMNCPTSNDPRGAQSGGPGSVDVQP